MPEKKFIIQNSPFMGLDTDTAEHYVKQNKARDMLNARILGVDGKGLQIGNVRGNISSEFVQSKGWSFRQDYVPLGYCQHEGIAYIMSQCVNPANPEFGTGEVGTYPSPNWAVNGVAGQLGYTKRYFPLRNFTNANTPLNHPFSPTFGGFGHRVSFRTPRFNFDCANQIDMQARVDYDNSVNIYFADDRNPFRVINSGFNHVTGLHNDRYHFAAQFDSSINAFNESGFHPIINLAAIIDQGGLLCGNYIFYFRYSTADLNPTSWLGESGPVQISKSPLSDNFAILGGPGSVSGNKTVRFNISNVDQSYKYIEVAQVHFGDDQTQTIHRIDRLYDISNQSSVTIEINGLEAKIPMDQSEIQRQKPLQNIPKTIVQMENRMWIGNIRREASFNQDLVDYAKAVQVFHDNTLQKNTPFYDEAGGTNNLSAVTLADSLYKNPALTYNNVGYHRGETYPFALMFVLTSGALLEPIAVTAIDNFSGAAVYGAGDLTENDKGIFRFPNVITNPYIDATASTVTIMGVRFRFSAGVITPWMQNNIAGAYLVRGERIQNKIFQGLITRVYRGAEETWEGLDLPGNRNPGDNDHHVIQKNKKVPNILRDFPFLWRDDSGVGQPDFDCYQSFEAVGYSYREYLYTTYPIPVGFYAQMAVLYPGFGIPFAPSPSDVCEFPAVYEWENQYGFFSIDHFLSNQPLFQDVVFQAIGLWNDISYDTRYNTWLRQQVGYDDDAWAKGMYFADHHLSGASYNTTTYTAKAVHVQEFDKVGESDFNSYYEQGEESAAFPFYSDESKGGIEDFHLKNMAFGVTRYIGLDMSNSSPAPINVFGLEEPMWHGGTRVPKVIANLYRTDPTTLSAPAFLTMYDPDDVIYYKISNFIPIATLAAAVDITAYRGDCFIGRNYIKTLYRDEGVYEDGREAPEAGLMKFGMAVGLVTECDANANLRHPDQSKYNVYPGNSNIGDIKTYVIEDNDFESSEYNEGYHRVLGVQGFFGFNGQIPADREDFPTRIMYSEFHENNAIQDFYRQFLTASYEDFDYTYGEIMELRQLRNQLISIQRSAVSMHIVNERAMIPSSEGSLTVGSGSVLSKKIRSISGEFGTQHQWSVVQSENFIYGVDFRNRKIWKAGYDGSFELISDTKLIRKTVVDWCEQFGTESDVIETFADNAVCNEGIVLAWDKRYNDIIITFIGNNAGGQAVENLTIAYSEWLGAFSSRYSFASPFYISINEDFFSMLPTVFPSQAPIPVAGFTVKSYLHDIEINPQGTIQPWRTMFYDQPYNFEFEIIANNEPDVVKIFDNIMLNSDEHEAFSTRYESRHGLSTHVWFTNPAGRHIDPLYEENMWRFPITRLQTQLNVNPNIAQVMRYPVGGLYGYGVGAPFRDEWLKIRFTYTKHEPIFIKSVNTFVRVSRQ